MVPIGASQVLINTVTGREESDAEENAALQKSGASVKELVGVLGI